MGAFRGLAQECQPHEGRIVGLYADFCVSFPLSNEKERTIGPLPPDLFDDRDHSVAASATSIVTPGPMVEVSEMRFM